MKNAVTKVLLLLLLLLFSCLLTDTLFPRTGLHGLSCARPCTVACSLKCVDPMRQMDLRSRDLEDSPQPSPGSHLAQGAKSRKGDFGGESSLLKPIPSYTTASRESSSLTPSGKGGGISSTPSSAGATLNTSLGKASTSSRVWLGKPIVRSGLRARAGLEPRQMERPTQHHNFLADVADVRQIEQGLLQLMEDFQAGNLRAFGKNSSLLCNG